MGCIEDQLWKNLLAREDEKGSKRGVKKFIFHENCQVPSASRAKNPELRMLGQIFKIVGCVNVLNIVEVVFMAPVQDRNFDILDFVVAVDKKRDILLQMYELINILFSQITAN